MNLYNLLDDTGMEMVNALREIRGLLSGEQLAPEVIRRTDHPVIMLDSTGRKLVAELKGISGLLGALVPDGGSGAGTPQDTALGAALRRLMDSGRLQSLEKGDPMVLAEADGASAAPFRGLTRMQGGRLEVHDGGEWRPCVREISPEEVEEVTGT